MCSSDLEVAVSKPQSTEVEKFQVSGDGGLDLNGEGEERER